MMSTLNLDAFNAYLDAAQKKHPTKNLAERLGTTDRTLPYRLTICCAPATNWW